MAHGTDVTSLPAFMWGLRHIDLGEQLGFFAAKHRRLDIAPLDYEVDVPDIPESSCSTSKE